jgi:tetratricopeptide (TPR) repeat protein
VIIRLKDVELEHVSLSQFGLFDRTMQAMYIWAYYIWRPWYPVNLAPVYTTLVSFDPLSLPFVASAIVVIGMIILLILLRRRWPLGLTLAVCYLALLVPVLGVLEHPHYPCDRYSLIVSICLSVLLAVFLANAKTKGLVSYIAIFLSIAVITSLGTLSWRQTRVWNNTASLFEHMIRTFGDDPYNYEIHRRLGIFYFKQGRYTEAMELFKKTIEINPVQINPAFSADAHNYPGLALEQQGKYAEALAHFTQAVQLMPDLAKARNNLAKALVIEGQIDEALEQFRAAIRLRPDWPALMNDFAFLVVTHPELKSRDVNEAIRLASRACVLTNYKNTAFLSTLAVAYSSANRFSEAAQTLETALNLDPNSAPLHNGLGNVLLSQGKFKGAISQMKRSLEIEPNNPDAKNDMAWILATCPDSNMRNPSEAIRLAQEACSATNYRKAGKLDTLGAAYASAGRFAEAIETAEKALSLVDQSQIDLRKTIQSHLDLYKVYRPYIETQQKDQNAK